MKDLRFVKHSPSSLFEERFSSLLIGEGYKGYGIYWALIENLFGQPDYAYPLKSVGLLATRMGLRKTYLLRIITNYGLFHLTETHFSAPFLGENLKKMTRNPENQTTANNQNSADKQNSADNQHVSTDQTFADKVDSSARQESEKNEQPEETAFENATGWEIIESDCVHNSPQYIPDMFIKESLNDDTTHVEANYLPCNSLKISDGFVQTRIDKDIDKEEDKDKEKIHSHTNSRARARVVLHHCRDDLMTKHSKLPEIPSGLGLYSSEDYSTYADCKNHQLKRQPYQDKRIDSDNVFSNMHPKVTTSFHINQNTS